MSLTRAARRRITAPTPLMRKERENNALRDALAAMQKERDEQTRLCAKALSERDSARSEVITLAGRISTNRESTESRVKALKRTISDLEKQLADAQGYIRAGQDQTFRDSPVIEVPQPPRVTTKAALMSEAGATLNYSPGGGYTDRELFGRATTSTPKHWTEL
jgi:hypothetical protein